MQHRFPGQSRGASGWHWLLLVLGVAVLASSCASQTQAPAPTATPVPFFPTTAADPAWQVLEQRPLHLPTLAPGVPCPTTPGHVTRPDLGIGLGPGPVYPILGQVTADQQQAEREQTQGHLPYDPTGKAGWGGMKVLWVIAPSYAGFVLIRGHQLDGPHGVGFNGGLDQAAGLDPTGDLTAPPLPALRLVAPVPGEPDPWVNWPSLTRVQAPGCYAYQVDGSQLSAVLVFQAIKST